LTPEYPPRARLGGIATNTLTMGGTLSRLGHEVQVVTPAPAGVSMEDGITVARVETGPRLRPAIKQFRTFHQIAKAAIAFNPDVVHAAEFGANAWWLTRFTRIPVVTRFATPSGMVTDINGRRWGPGTHLVDYLERDQTLRSALLYAPTKAIARSVSSNWRLAPELIEVIPNSVNLSAVREAGALPSHRPLPERFIVFFGRLEVRKGIVPFGQALPAVLTAHPDLHVVLVAGEAPESAAEIAEFKQALSPFAGRVHFLGELPRNDALAVVARAELSVAPSLWESFGYALVEAMALGVPLIATDCGGIPEIVEEGRSGWLVPPGDADALRNALLKRLADRDVLKAAREKQAGAPIISIRTLSPAASRPFSKMRARSARARSRVRSFRTDTGGTSAPRIAASRSIASMTRSGARWRRN
jgi:glycogen(starch) synthase